MKNCSVKKCNNSYKCKGYCRKHYEQWFNTGNPIATHKKIKRMPNELCFIFECKNKRTHAQYCSKHYMRFYRHGVNLSSNRDIVPINKVINKTKINSLTGCLEWIKPLSEKQHYPIITIGTKRLKAHRFIYEYFIGPIPKDLNVLHKCDNTICCEISHLFLGTQAHNINDMIKKGRNNHYSILTAKNVIKIRKLIQNGKTLKYIGNIYGVHPNTIAAIKQGKSWRKI